MMTLNPVGRLSALAENRRYGSTELTAADTMHVSTDGLQFIHGVRGVLLVRLFTEAGIKFLFF